MNNIYNTYKPEGFGNMSPYIMAGNAIELIEFLKNAFYAEELHRSVGKEDGRVQNCIMKIGDTCFMVSQGRDQFLNMRTSFYLYVADVDVMHKRALSFGAKEEFAPADMPYNDRQSGVVDPSGNYWWISKRLKEEDYQ